MEEPALHPELAANGSFAHLRLGKLDRKNDPRTLRLARYLTPDAAYPDHVDWTAAVASWPMMGNDRLGDCTCAAAGHMIEAWTANAGAPATPTDDDVVAAYWATGSGDTGRFELDVLNFWRTQGIAGHKILAYVAVDPQNLDHVRYAIATFGGVYAGVALPLSAQGQASWSVVGDGRTGPSRPGSWGGHAIPYHAYDIRTPSAPTVVGQLRCVTWGAVLALSEAFHLAYCDELYAIVTEDWVAATGASPTGLDLDALLADLRQVQQTATPEGITVGAPEHQQPPDGFQAAPSVPVFPWEIALRNATYWMQPLPDGGMVLKFAPSQPVPQGGQMAMPPGVEVVFSPDGWEAFKRKTAADGAQETVVVARPQLIVPGRWGARPRDVGRAPVCPSRMARSVATTDDPRGGGRR